MIDHGSIVDPILSRTVVVEYQNRPLAGLGLLSAGDEMVSFKTVWSNLNFDHFVFELAGVSDTAREFFLPLGSAIITGSKAFYFPNELMAEEDIDDFYIEFWKSMAYTPNPSILAYAQDISSSPQVLCRFSPEMITEYYQILNIGSGAPKFLWDDFFIKFSSKQANS